ncbi:hypothetical protein AVEN_194959-1 [Araneus ventricosus]|uniref:Uncharacterized protein n=1 Tax=Araneus ventricosus TaxID=182803 RepID=A0A4Y2EXW4_ARAVE|nr:hypothetical protein AVEN_194959-1 [Araneus ventricosus]
MSLKLNIRKDELIAIAKEMGLTVPDKAKVVDLKALIESSDVYRDDIELVRNLIDNILEEKREKLERDKQREELESERDKREYEIEKIKLAQLEKQLEIENARKNLANTTQATEIGETGSLNDNLESLIKSVKTLTIPVPVRSESFNLFFHSLEKAFQIKSVPNELKAEILLNLLGEKVNNLLAYVSQEDLCDYEKIKQLVLKEFEPTPQECLSNFKKAQRLPSETYVQFASRLCASFDYYFQLRKVTDFGSLCDLIVSDRIFETLDRELMTRIAVKQGESFLNLNSSVGSVIFTCHRESRLRFSWRKISFFYQPKLLQVIDPSGGEISWKTILPLTLCAGALQKFRFPTLDLTFELKMVVFFTRLGSVTKILVVGGLGQRGFRLRKEKREAEKGKKRAALASGRIRNFAADYLLGRAGDAGFGRKRPCRSTYLLNEYAVSLG